MSAAMAPSDSQRTRHAAQRGGSAVPDSAGRSDAASPQRRTDGQLLDTTVSGRDRRLMAATSESWIEVASQPSSSSLSSIGDHIVTTGLRVGGNSYQSRRRRSQQQQQPMPASFVVCHPASQAGATSSQDEYDETESEEDRVMTSSTEAIHPSASLLRQQTTVRAAVETDSESDGDENATALGRPSNAPVFRPQPNAFSHPPSHLTHRHSTGSAQPYNHPSSARPSMPNRPHTRTHRGAAPNYMSPSYQADNDAALRASLTTLLSCAAAARGLPKQQHEERGRAAAGGGGTGVVPSSQPMELRLVPESELMAESPPPAPAARGAAADPSKSPPQQARTASNSSAPSAPSSNTGRDNNKDDKSSRRAAAAARKKRASSGAAVLDTTTTPDSTTTASPFLSPTLLTWVISAGVVVLVSVVGFGAGYVIGREVGRQEGASAAASFGGPFSSSASSNASSCGRELVRSTASAGGSGGTLRRIRWADVGRSVAA